MKKYYKEAIEKECIESMINFGTYYRDDKINYAKMKKYYLMAIERKNTTAMYYMGTYYHEIKINYVKMKRYYLMAIKLGETFSMVALGDYYRDRYDVNKDKMTYYYHNAIKMENYHALLGLGYYYEKEKQYDTMEKYYLEALDRGIIEAAYGLAIYYKKIRNYPKMKEYCTIAIQYKHCGAMTLLGDYYKNIKQKYLKMEKYYMMAIEKGYKCASTNYISYLCEIGAKKRLLEFLFESKDYTLLYESINSYLQTNILDQETENYLLRLLYLNSIDDHPILNLIKRLLTKKMNLIKVHFEYSIYSHGFEEAKTDFTNYCVLMKSN